MERIPASPEEGAAQKAEWETWVADLGDALVNPGTPLRGSMFVRSGGQVAPAVTGALTGYSILEACDMDAALEIAKGCPFLVMGAIEVAELLEM